MNGAPDLRGRRVLITGGLGFIGSNLAHRCLALNAEVTVYDCLDPLSGGNRANVEEIRDDLRLVSGDIRDFDGVRAVVSKQDIVFNCAAYTSHPHSMKDPYTDLEVNCKGVLNVLEAIRNFNPDAKLVHVGTSTQIGRMRYSPVDEMHPEFPLDMYSANKTASEKYVLVYAQAYGLRGTVVRLANTYGPRSSIRNPDLGFMNYFVGLALRGKPIPVFGDGAQRRTITYVEDSVEALVRASASAKSDGKVYFATAERQYTVAEIARAIGEGIGGDVRFVDWPKDRIEIEIGDAVIASAAMREELGWTATIDLADGLAKTRDYFLPRLEAYL